MSENFADRVAVLYSAVCKLKEADVKVHGGHLVGTSLMLHVHAGDFERLAENGWLVDVVTTRMNPLHQISGNITEAHEAVFTYFPEVRVMAISITPAPAVPVGQVRSNPQAPIVAEEDSWPIPF